MVGEVDLNQQQMYFASLVGITRHVLGGWGIPSRYGMNDIEDGFQNHCVGAAGEMAFAKWSGLFWDVATIGLFTQKDVARYQIRTRTRAHYDLMLHDRDRDDDIFVLVLAHHSPHFIIRGWIQAGDGKQQKYFGEHGAPGRPAYFVPQADLWTMDRLPGLGVGS